MKRLEFDASVPRAVQLLRVAENKKPGRKHRKQPGAKAKEKMKTSQKRAAKLRSIRANQYHAKVAAYWRGELEEFPA